MFQIHFTLAGVLRHTHTHTHTCPKYKVSFFWFSNFVVCWVLLHTFSMRCSQSEWGILASSACQRLELDSRLLSARALCSQSQPPARDSLGFSSCCGQKFNSLCLFSACECCPPRHASCQQPAARSQQPAASEPNPAQTNNNKNVENIVNINGKTIFINLELLPRAQLTSLTSSVHWSNKFCAWKMPEKELSIDVTARRLADALQKHWEWRVKRNKWANCPK